MRFSVLRDARRGKEVASLRGGMRPISGDGAQQASYDQGGYMTQHPLLLDVDSPLSRCPRFFVFAERSLKGRRRRRAKPGPRFYCVCRTIIEGAPRAIETVSARW